MWEKLRRQWPRLYEALEWVTFALAAGAFLLAPITVMPPQMIQCSGVNGMQTPHKICKPTHKITKVQIVPTMSVGISNA